MQPAIRVENLSKHYALSAGPRADRNLQENLVHGLRSLWRKCTGRAEPARSFWALDGVSFDVQPGEVLGVVGRNGAGKSTLLKILSRVVEPTRGRAEIRGRMGSLLEVGTGFHPELSGRENIFLNGSLIGMSRSEIRRHFDEIVAFADMAEFIDTPVKRYSSGMHVRLAFAIAAHLNPEILILDEVLAVGDAQFQQKCLGKMRDVAQSGRTILFVSHDMSAIRRLCNRCLMLSKGQVVASGPTSEVVSRYLEIEESRSRPGVVVPLHDAVRRGNGEARFTELTWSGGDARVSGVATGSPMIVDVTIEAARPRVVDSISVFILDQFGTKLMNADSCIHGQTLALAEGPNRLQFRIRSVPLNPGRYVLGLWLSQRPAPLFDYIEQACEIEVVPAPGDTRLRPQADGLIHCDFDVVRADDIPVSPSNIGENS